MGEGVRVDGLNATIKQLGALGADIEDMKDVMASIAAEGASLAAGFAPKRSGALARTIRGNRAKAKAVVSAGRARVPYAGPINYGWARKGIRASKFMQRADAVMIKKAPLMLEEGLGKVITKVGLAE